MRGAASTAAALALGLVAVIVGNSHGADVLPDRPTAPDVVTWSGVAAVPLVSGVLQVFHRTGWVPDNYAPLLGLFIGITGGLIASYATGAALVTGGLQGVMVGLAASGLWQIMTTGNGAPPPRP